MCQSSIIDMQRAACCTVQRNDEIRAKNSNLPGSPFAQHCKHLIPETILGKTTHLQTFKKLFCSMLFIHTAGNNKYKKTRSKHLWKC